MIRAFIYYLGTLFINKKVWQHYKRLKSGQEKELDVLKKEQFEKLQLLLEFAYKNSSYYMRLFDSNDFKPDMIRSLEDIKKIPVVTKSDLIKFNKEIHTNQNQKTIIFSETSGSTGESLGFYRTKDWDASTRAAMFRGYSWYGVKPWDKNGYFWGYNISNSLKIRILDALQNRFRIFSYDKDQIVKFIKKLRSATFLEGYSSMIYEIAKIINRENIQHNLNLKLVKGTSEKIFDHYNDEAKNAFGKKIVSEYGAAETGVIAFECPYGNMHITMENVIVETENNEIIVTNLYSYSFPIIRYKLGDFIKLSTNSECKCGMKHEIIEEIYGRVGKLIKGNSNDYPSLILYYIFKNISLEHNIHLKYQAIQKDFGQLIFNIENEIDENVKSLVMSQCKKYFKDDIECKIYDKMTSLRDSGKLEDFISYL